MFRDFTITPVEVSHSIPETMGLLINPTANPKIEAFYISDFKVDIHPDQEVPFPLHFLKKRSALSEKRLLLCDSTNVCSSKEKTPSERDLVPFFDKMLKEAPKRVFITMFASNVERMKLIYDLCKKHKRRLVPYGRAFGKYLYASSEVGFFSDAKEFMDNLPEQDEDCRDVILLTGCQGDFRSALSRVAEGIDPAYRLRPDDYIIFSSKSIPGNENNIAKIINKLSMKCDNLFTAENSFCHVSGHPGKEDLRALLNHYKPTDVAPIHGEVYFLKQHKKFIDNEFKKIKSHFLLNYWELAVHDDGSIRLKANMIQEPKIIGPQDIVIKREFIRERRKVAGNGAFFVSITENKQRKGLSIQMTPIGLPIDILPNQFAPQLNTLIENEYFKNSRKSYEELVEHLRITIRRKLNQVFGTKPSVIIHIK